MPPTWLMFGCCNPARKSLSKVGVIVEVRPSETNQVRTLLIANRRKLGVDLPRAGIVVHLFRIHDIQVMVRGEIVIHFEGELVLVGKRGHLPLITGRIQTIADQIVIRERDLTQDTS